MSVALTPASYNATMTTALWRDVWAIAGLSLAFAAGSVYMRARRLRLRPAVRILVMLVFVNVLSFPLAEIFRFCMDPLVDCVADRILPDRIEKLILLPLRLLQRMLR